MDKKDPSCPHDMRIRGNVTVGPKWQVVIPKDVRDLLGIDCKDNLVVITKWNSVVGFVRNNDVNHIIDYIQSEMAA